MLFAFCYSADICTDGVKAMAVKSASAFAQIKIAAQAGVIVFFIAIPPHPHPQ